MNCLRLIQRLHQGKIFSVSAVKYISNHPIKFNEVERRWKNHDGIPDEFHLIYKGPMTKYINYLSTYLTATTTIISASSIYYASAVFEMSNIDSPIVIGDMVIANNGYESLAYIASFVLLHIGVKLVLNKFVVRMYQNEEKYIAVTIGHLHNMLQKNEFSRNDVQKLNTMFVVTWPDARFSLGNKHAILLENYFKTPQHYNYLVNKAHKSDPNRD